MGHCVFEKLFQCHSNRLTVVGSAKPVAIFSISSASMLATDRIYNHKRHGEFVLGGRKFSFRVKPSFPKTLTKEFLLVDLVNNLDQLAEAKNEVLERARERAASYETQRLQRAVRDYGNVRTKKFFDWVLKASPLNYAA
jgi:hypothetical protein